MLGICQRCDIKEAFIQYFDCLGTISRTLRVCRDCGDFIEKNTDPKQPIDIDYWMGDTQCEARSLDICSGDETTPAPMCVVLEELPPPTKEPLKYVAPVGISFDGLLV